MPVTANSTPQQMVDAIVALSNSRLNREGRQVLKAALETLGVTVTAVDPANPTYQELKTALITLQNVSPKDIRKGVTINGVTGTNLEYGVGSFLLANQIGITVPVSAYTERIQVSGTLPDGQNRASFIDDTYYYAMSILTGSCKVDRHLRSTMAYVDSFNLTHYNDLNYTLVSNVVRQWGADFTFIKNTNSSNVVKTNNLFQTLWTASTSAAGAARYSFTSAVYLYVISASLAFTVDRFTTSGARSSLTFAFPSARDMLSVWTENDNELWITWVNTSGHCYLSKVLADGTIVWSQLMGTLDYNTRVIGKTKTGYLVIHVNTGQTSSDIRTILMGNAYSVVWSKTIGGVMREVDYVGKELIYVGGTNTTSSYVLRVSDGAVYYTAAGTSTHFYSNPVEDEEGIYMYTQGYSGATYGYARKQTFKYKIAAE